MNQKNKRIYDIIGTEAPEMPETLPKFLNLAVQNAPEHTKLAILKSLFLAMGSLMHGA